jgi:DNA-binding CsgD family transcriptional regulator
LTPTELRIAELVGQGLTSPQIGARLYISPRTVQTHISHALRKLGLRSRVELATTVTRHGR